VTAIEKAYAAVEAALEKKGYDLGVFEAEHLKSVADYFLVVTGRSDVQCQAIARGIEERLGGEGMRPLAIEGFQHAHWILLDYDDVVVHIFYEPSREFYRLETNWLDANAVALPEPLSRQAKELRLHASG
jgi:ribosome-associated protein